MRITFCAFGNLRRYTPDRQERLPLDLPERATVDDALARIGVPWEEVGFVVVNGKMADRATELADGDRVEAFSPIGGG